MQYYIAYDRIIKDKKIIKKGKIIAHGQTSNGKSGVSPISAEEVFDDFKEYRKTLKRFNIKAKHKK